MLRCASNEQDQVSMKKPLLENTTILPWETAGCKLGYPRRMRLGRVYSVTDSPNLIVNNRYPRRMRLGRVYSIMR